MTDLLQEIVKYLRLHQCGFTVEDVLDSIWLSRYLDDSTEFIRALTTAAEKEDETEKRERGGFREDIEQQDEFTVEQEFKDKPPGKDTQIEEPGDEFGDVYLPRAAGKEIQGKPIRIPSAPVISNKLELSRALRPFMQRKPSRYRYSIDEERSAYRIADEGIWEPVLLPAMERWFQVELVMDVGASMDVWHNAGYELLDLLKWMGAFRNIKTWSLDSDNLRPKLYPGFQGFFHGAQPRHPLELVDTGRRHLILILTDCVSTAWHTGGITELLEHWVSKGPAAIIQVFPRYLWNRSALRNAEPVHFFSPFAASPNTKLKWKSTAIISVNNKEKDKPGIPVPIVPFDLNSIGNWARLVTGTNIDNVVRGAIFRRESRDALLQEARFTTERSPSESLERFWMAASPLARRLALLISASPSISLQVIRLIRTVLLPEATHVHEAEILLSGMLKVVKDSDEDDFNPDDIQYEFRGNIRSELLDNLPARDSLNVLSVVSFYIEEHLLGNTRSFRAILANPSKAVGSIAVGDNPIAKITAAILRRLGGDYSRLVKRKEKKIEEREKKSTAEDVMKSEGKIIIVDDEEDNRELFENFLEHEGYDCYLAANADEALKIFKSTPGIDLVITNHRMPGKSGLELLDEIKDIDSDVMVVIFSAVKDIDTAITALSKGAYDYVSIPFKLAEVELIAKKAIEKRRLVLENKEYQREFEKKVSEEIQKIKKALYRLDKNYLSTLRALVTAVDNRDEKKREHSLRVAQYALKLAELLGIKDERLLMVIEYGALLHDIGKIGIPDAILNKPGKLTDVEWEMMKNHPKIGYEIIHKIEFLQEASQIVLHHHENWNGSGYPDGLKGVGIPFASRIVAVVNTLDDMISRKPYRKALTFEAAKEELVKSSGIQFDPEVVDAFTSVSLSYWKEKRKDIEPKFTTDNRLVKITEKEIKKEEKKATPGHVIKGQILIVDSETDIRELIGDFLEGEGYDCYLATHADEALEIFKSTPGIDLVMSDIRPGKSGLELLGEIKDIDSDVMVVMVSAVKDIESAITAMSKGAYDYVAKPFKLTELGLIAKKAIEKRRLVLENKEYQKKLERKVVERTRKFKEVLFKLDKTYLFILRALVAAMDNRDEKKRGHSLRVAQYALRLANLLGIKDKKQLKVIEYGALLHDIGKIGIPDAILKKPGKLTDVEWDVMKNHPKIGYEIIHKIEFLQEASRIVLHHHENWNGSGYPDGLKGVGIPIASRIVAVVNTLDAMISEKPYRKALTFEAAKEELIKLSGIQFDPKVVEAFTSVSLSYWKEIQKNMDSKIFRDEAWEL